MQTLCHNDAAVIRYSYLLYLAAASAAAADVAEMKASQVEGAPTHTPGHHDLAPINSTVFHTFNI